MKRVFTISPGERKCELSIMEDTGPNPVHVTLTVDTKTGAPVKLSNIWAVPLTLAVPSVLLNWIGQVNDGLNVVGSKLLALSIEVVVQTSYLEMLTNTMVAEPAPGFVPPWNALPSASVIGQPSALT